MAKDDRARADRLKAALRENLRRRKAQQRGRALAPPREAGPSGEGEALGGEAEPARAVED